MKIARPKEVRWLPEITQHSERIEWCVHYFSTLIGNRTTGMKERFSMTYYPFVVAFIPLKKDESDEYNNRMDMAMK